MITIITEMTDPNIFKNFWMPLICKHREVNFIFGKTESLEYPPSFVWSNVKFGAKLGVKDLVKYAKTDIVYITKQNEIPTYELMVRLRNPQEAIIPKIHGTDTDSSSFTAKKDKYIKAQGFGRRIVQDVTTYLI